MLWGSQLLVGLFHLGVYEKMNLPRIRVLHIGQIHNTEVAGMYEKHEMEIVAFDHAEVFAWGNTTISGSETPGYDEESIKTPTSDI